MRSKILRFITCLLTVLLALGVMVESTGKGGILVSYLINKAYITSNLCENRADKSKHCNGKCYLMKQLKQQDKQQQSSTPATPVHQEEIIMDMPGHSLLVVLNNQSVSADIYPERSHYHSRNGSDIFHPPA
jgi:hypothetical protein